jgi:hypothetical protein
VVNAVIATRENVVRVEFSAVAYWDGLLTKRDASTLSFYTLSTVAGTKGFDDSPVRPVTILGVSVTDTSDETIFAPGSAGRFLDITVDRPFTPYPAQYTLSMNGLFTPDITTSSDWTPLDGPSSTNVAFYGVQKVIAPPRVDADNYRKDFANTSSSNTAKGLVNSADADNPLMLGTFAYDEQGDYAADEGEVSLMKRIFRRMFSKPGAFLHLGPGYGLGLTGYGKKLIMAGLQQRIQAEAVRQIQREPEVAKAAVMWRQDPNYPMLVRITILVRTKTGRTLKYAAPVSLKNAA